MSKGGCIIAHDTPPPQDTVKSGGRTILILLSPYIKERKQSGRLLQILERIEPLHGRNSRRTAASKHSFIICSVFTQHPDGNITIIRNLHGTFISIRFMQHFFCSNFQHVSSLLDLLTLVASNLIKIPNL